MGIRGKERGRDIDYPWGDDEASCLHADIHNPNLYQISFRNRLAAGRAPPRYAAAPRAIAIKVSVI